MVDTIQKKPKPDFDPAQKNIYKSATKEKKDSSLGSCANQIDSA